MTTLPNSLPRGMTPKPEAKKFEKPVAWLFGRQFIATLKFVLLYTAFKGKLDSRDWMNPEILDLETPWKKSPDASNNEFWFDYISDTGDGQKAMYSVAHLCMSDLYVGNKRLGVGDDVMFVEDPKLKQLPESNKTLLPRGEFLFVGGDTSYHISDYASLANRFQNPFWWAFTDLPANANANNYGRPIFGIPGNHDYYDSLDGFNRQFRRPCTSDHAEGDERDPLLKLPTFERFQEASYIALRLPFGWWFWGLDTENGEIDFRQLDFFNHIKEKHDPRKLIVATPEPTISFGKAPDPNSNQSKTFRALMLEEPFFGTEAGKLSDDQCRVDLSGDIHHYARYFGPEPESEATSNYASVMSGGGGAFFHPSQTNVHQIRQQALYPSADASRNQTSKQLFNFINIWNGGLVYLFGFLMAFSLFFTAYFPKTGRDAVNSFPPFVRLGVSPGAAEISSDVWAPKPLTHYVWTGLIVLSLALLFGALIKSRKLFKKRYDPAGPRREEIPLRRRLVIWALVASSFVALALGLKVFHSEAFLHPYSHSVIVFAALVWAFIAVVETVLYSGWLFEECYRTNVHAWHYWPIWTLLIMAALELGTALWYFGKHGASYLIADLVQLTIVLGVLIGLTYFAVVIGGGLRKGIGKAGFFALGILHALLQLLVPFLLIRMSNGIGVLVALVVVVMFQLVGTALAKLKNGWPLAIASILFGAALLAIPYFIRSASSPNIPDGFGPTMFLCISAGAIGMVMSCALFGWYLGVALAFNGHNNEAGGAARIEGFKHLIRFRLSPDGLTGYVIALDQVGTERSELHPRIVDIFRICGRQ